MRKNPKIMRTSYLEAPLQIAGLQNLRSSFHLIGAGAVRVDLGLAVPEPGAGRGSQGRADLRRVQERPHPATEEQKEEEERRRGRQVGDPESGSPADRSQR